MPIASLKLTNVGPFDDIEFEFDRQVNVFTGPNNSGKSAALAALGDILVANFEFPRKLLREGENAAFAVLRNGSSRQVYKGELPISVDDNIGHWTPQRRSRHRQLVQSLGYTGFIPALRLNADFRSPGSTIKVGAGKDERPLTGERQNRFAKAALISDEDVVQQIINLDYRSYRRKEPASRDIIVKIGEMAAEITEGFPIKFLGVAEDARGLFPQFHTPDGNMPLNALSQGTQSLIQWLAHFLIGYAEYYEFPESLEDKPGIFIVDEIDAHLHPSWQRRIIPTLTRHFPSLQIFCSTHSPLMLAGLKEGQAQLLRREETGKVVVSRNESDIIGWSVDEITRILLDVPNPTDLETVKHLERLQELRHKQTRQTLSAAEAAELEKLRHTVNQDLLGGPMAAQIDRFVEILEQAKAEQQAQREPAPATPARPPRRRRKVSE